MVLWLLSALAVAYAVLKLAKFLRALYLVLTPGYDLLQRYKTKTGETPYALITGASDGVGKALALRLARKGFSLILVARNAEKLQDVVRECQASGKGKGTVDVRTVILDLAANDYETVRGALASAVQGLPVTLLINNAGVAPDTLRVCEFEPQDHVAAARAISLNVTAFTAVAAGVLPRLSEAGEHAGVISVSSASAIFGLKYSAVYAGSKGFNRAFSLSLSAEMAPLRVDALALTPFFFSSGMVKMRKQFFLETADAVAIAALAALGRRQEAAGTFKHELLMFLLNVLPSALAGRAADAMDRSRLAVLKARKGR